MKNIKLTLAYDGTHYLGWQESIDGPTIEGTLKGILEQIIQQKVQLQAASRTDRGVHAEMQVVNFFLENDGIDLKQLQMSLNQMLPKDICILSLEEMPNDFHPTLDAKGKEYHYIVTNTHLQLPFKRHFSWHFRSPLCLDTMRKAAKNFVGTHDFKAFCNANDGEDKESVRTLYRLDIFQMADGFRFEIQGNHFLYKMVRNLVGTLVYFGAGKLPLELSSNLLKQRDRTLAGMTAPAHGLVLKKVHY